MATVLSPHHVHTTLNYVSLDGVGSEGLYHYVESPPEGMPKSNIKEDIRPAIIHDVRGQEETVGLDKTGFQFVRHVSEEKKFLDEDVIKTRYYKEVEELLKKEAGAKRVFVFDHTIRRFVLVIRNAFTSTRHTPPPLPESIPTLVKKLTGSLSPGLESSTYGARLATKSPILHSPSLTFVRWTKRTTW